MKTIIKIIAKTLAFIIAFISLLFLHFYITAEADNELEKTRIQNSCIKHNKTNDTIIHAEKCGVASCELIVSKEMTPLTNSPQ